MQEINFIIIDDSKEDCFLIVKRLESLNMDFNIITFLSAQEAYKYILDSNHAVFTGKNIIILDIYMPLMDGFEFMEAFEKLPVSIQNNYIIYALTSSINKSFVDKISTYKSVKSSLEKPIKTESLLTLIEANK